MSARFDWNPQRVEQMRKWTEAGATAAWIGKQFGLTEKAIGAARFRHGVAKPGKFAHRGIPEDFTKVGPTMTVRQAAEHYKACRQSIRNWFKVTETEPSNRRYARQEVTFTPSYRAPRKAGASTMRTFIIPDRGSTQAASAQLHLQRYGPVVRASTLDSRAPADQWIVMGRRMSEAEMLAVAERKGWRAMGLAA